MSIVHTLSLLALKEVLPTVVGGKIAEASTALVSLLVKHFNDPSQRLAQALHAANDRSWKAIEIGLAGDSVWEKCKVVVASGEDKAFRQQLQIFLDTNPLPAVQGKVKFREQCLLELREARKAGVLSGGKLPTAEMPNQAAAFARFQNQQALEQEWKLFSLLVKDLKLAKYENLAWLVSQRPANGMPLLVLSARYFFRRHVEGDPALQTEMTFRTLEGLQESQAAGFRGLHTLFAQHSQRLDALFGLVVANQQVLQRTADHIKDAVDGQSEHIQRIEQGVMQLLGKMGQRELSSSDSLSIRSDAERAAVKELLASYRSLPEEQRKRLPGLLGKIGKLEIATGHFEEAQRDFDRMATLSQDPHVQAEANYNAYLAALERRDWAVAFRKLYETLRLDAKRYAPFPINNYKPNRILGAGGFGIVFLCKHAALGDSIVVKALRTDNLDRDADNLFDEAKILRNLNHPAVIKLWECGYLQVSTKSRPYLVMDYFDGVSLEEHVRQQGCLSPDDLKGIALPVAEALQAAHEQNILHRDVKPANILIRKEGDEWQVRLIDFGLALKQSVLQAPSSRIKSDTHGMVEKSIAGTVDYAAPEQMGKVDGPVGPHSDVYAFGKTCYYALLQTPEPDDDEKKEVPLKWRKLLNECTARTIESRLSDFEKVVKRLSGFRATKKRRARKAKAKSETHDAAPTVTETPVVAGTIKEPAQEALTVICQQCRKPLSVPKQILGRLIKCPHCSVVFRCGARSDPGPPPPPSNKPLAQPVVQPVAPAAKPPAQRDPATPVHIWCPHCQQKLVARLGNVGQDKECPACRKRFVVAAAREASATRERK